MIGGTTDYDNNMTALLAIQTEWSNTGHDYSTRVNNIRGITNTGLNQGYLLTFNGTVHDDSQVDTMTGSAQQDWVFISTGDVVTGSTKGEQIN